MAEVSRCVELADEIVGSAAITISVRVLVLCWCWLSCYSPPPFPLWIPITP